MCVFRRNPIKLSKTNDMKRLTFMLLVLVFASGCSGDAGELTTFILIRHAEKGNDGTEDPDLTEQGISRAEKLSEMLRNTPIAAIYTTNYKRTRNTVAPLAKIHDTNVQPYEAFKPDVIEDMLEKHRGGTVVISGHSNTTPWTANLLTGSETYKDYAESEYGIILIVTVTGVGKGAIVTRINY